MVGHSQMGMRRSVGVSLSLLRIQIDPPSFGVGRLARDDRLQRREALAHVREVGHGFVCQIARAHSRYEIGDQAIPRVLARGWSVGRLTVGARDLQPHGRVVVAVLSEDVHFVGESHRPVFFVVHPYSDPITAQGERASLTANGDSSFGLSRRQIEMLNAFRRVVFYWDLDAYPQVESYAEKIQAECYVVLHSDGKDAGERTQEENAELLKNSVPVNSVVYQMFKMEHLS